MVMKSVDVNGTAIHYAIGGKGKNIIVVHGAGSNHTTWLNTIDHLKGARWIALDCRGHGKSEGTPDIDATVDDIIAIADKERMRTFVIAGICLGGTIAVEVAARHPSRVKGIIMFSPFDGKLIRFSVPLRLSCAVARAFIRLFPMRKTLAYNNYRLPPTMPFLLTWISDAKGIHARHYGTAAINSLKRPALRETHIPTLVVTGKKDAVLRRNLVADHVRHNRHAAWIELESNHHILTWRPKEAAAIINDFLRKAV